MRLKRYVANNFRLVLFLWILTVAGQAAESPSSPTKGPNEIFVAVLSPFSKPDETEQRLWKYLGGLPGIDVIIQPTTPEQLFDEVAKLTRKGKKIRYLILAGHGEATHPHVKLAVRELNNSDVDVAAIRAELSKTMGLNQLENQAFDSANSVDKDLVDLMVTRREEPREKLKRLDGVANSMAAGGTILLLNCSAAATADGKAMCLHLGQVFLGRQGGTVVASTRDIGITENDEHTWFPWLMPLWTGRWVSAGEVWLNGNWMRINIQPAKDPYLFAAFHPSALRQAIPGEQLEIAPEVDARPDSGNLVYSWSQVNPKGDSAPLSLTVRDNSTHRLNIVVTVRDKQGRTAQDTFTVRIQSTSIVGPDRTQAGKSVTLRVSVTPPRRGLTYKWTLSGATLGSQETLNFLQAKEGSYPVKLEVRDARGLVGTDTRTILVEGDAKKVVKPADVGDPTVAVSPKDIVVSDFFQMSCQVPASLQSKVAKYQWVSRTYSYESVLANTATPKAELQLFPAQVGSNFGVRLLDSQGHNLSQPAWADFKSFRTQAAQFSLSLPDTWTATTNKDGSLSLRKEPSLNINDHLDSGNSHAKLTGYAGDSDVEVSWDAAQPGEPPREWTVKYGNLKQKGMLAFRVKELTRTQGLSSSSDGPQGKDLESRLYQRYDKAVAANRDHTAQQVKDIIASLTITGDGKITKFHDPGVPGGPINTANITTTTTTTTNSSQTKAGDKIHQADLALNQGKLEEVVSSAQQAVQLDPQGSKKDVLRLVAELNARGWEAAYRKDFDTARRAFKGALTLKPGDKNLEKAQVKVDKAAAAWPKVQELGKQIEDLLNQRRLVTAQPLLSKLVSLGNDLMWRKGDQDPYVESVNRHFNDRLGEWNKFFQDTTQTIQARFKERDIQGVLDLLPALEGWELSPATRTAIDNLRVAAQRGLADQKEAWNNYTTIRSRFDKKLLDRAETYKSIDKLRLGLQYFGDRDPRQKKIQALIDELDKDNHKQVVDRPTPSPKPPPPPPPPTPNESLGTIEGQWSMTANKSYHGPLEFTRAGNGWTGRLNLDNHTWEAITHISYDPSTGDLSFFRPSCNQHYTGRVSGNQMVGRFDNAYTWSATRGTGSQNPARSVTGTWSIKQSNLATPFTVQLTQSGSRLTGTATCPGVGTGPVAGTIQGSSISFTITWNPHMQGIYSATLSSDLDHMLNGTGHAAGTSSNCSWSAVRR